MTKIFSTDFHFCFPSLGAEILDQGGLFFSQCPQSVLLWFPEAWHSQVLFGYYISCLVDPAMMVSSPLWTIWFLHELFSICQHRLPEHTVEWMNERVYATLSRTSHSPTSKQSHPAYSCYQLKAEISLAHLSPVLATHAAFLKLHTGLSRISTFHTWMSLSGPSSWALATVSSMIWLFLDISQSAHPISKECLSMTLLKCGA